METETVCCTPYTSLFVCSAASSDKIHLAHQDVKQELTCAEHLPCTRHDNLQRFRHSQQLHEVQTEKATAARAQKGEIAACKRQRQVQSQLLPVFMTTRLEGASPRMMPTQACANTRLTHHKFTDTRMAHKLPSTWFKIAKQ